MKNSVAVIDYGASNMHSVIRAIEHCGARVDLISKSSEIIKADRLILPGVGAFKDGMKSLEKSDVVVALQDFAQSGKPLLGICLGMQMLMDSSEEFGEYKGLGLIKGRVQKIASEGKDGEKHKIPHIGWKEIYPSNSDTWDSSLLKGVPVKGEMYFIHSYMAVPDDPNQRYAYCLYDGIEITAIIREANIYGCQFHPEKSGTHGLKIIDNFINLNF